MTSASEQTRSWSADLLDGKRFYPAGLNLQGRRALVVGSNTYVAENIQRLVEFGVRVDLLAKTVATEIRDLAITYSHRLTVLKKSVDALFAGEVDMAKYFLVYAFSDNVEENERVVELAHSKGVLATRVGLQLGNDFVVPSWLRRGHIKISVSTDGISGALEQVLINRIKSSLNQELDNFSRFAEFVRDKLVAVAESSPEDRLFASEIAQKMFYSEEVFLALQRNNIDEASHNFERSLDELIEEYRQRKP
jgi:siroheme synthase, N-terminal domain